MLSNATWNTLKQGMKWLECYKGRTFYSKRDKCKVIIYDYTLSGQLLYKSFDNNLTGTIWCTEYDKLETQERN